jgi:hypothetical protein
MVTKDLANPIRATGGFSADCRSSTGHRPPHAAHSFPPTCLLHRNTLAVLCQPLVNESKQPEQPQCYARLIASASAMSQPHHHDTPNMLPIAPAWLANAGSANRGWVSGVLAAKFKAAAPGCPPGVTPGSCKTCLGTKDPQTCFSCLRSIGLPSKCAVCANLPSPSGRAKCLRCVTNAPLGRAGCGACIQTRDAFDSAGTITATPAHTDAVERCMECAEKTNVADKRLCAWCLTAAYETPNVYLRNPSSCLACVANNSLSPEFRQRSCITCHASGVQEPAACMTCAASSWIPYGASDVEDCAACVTAVNVKWKSQCLQCLATMRRDEQYTCGLAQYVSAALTMGSPMGLGLLLPQP